MQLSVGQASEETCYDIDRKTMDTEKKVSNGTGSGPEKQHSTKSSNLSNNMNVA